MLSPLQSPAADETSETNNRTLDSPQLEEAAWSVLSESEIVSEASSEASFVVDSAAVASQIEQGKLTVDMRPFPSMLGLLMPLETLFEEASEPYAAEHQEKPWYSDGEEEEDSDGVDYHDMASADSVWERGIESVGDEPLSHQQHIPIDPKDALKHHECAKPVSYTELNQGVSAIGVLTSMVLLLGTASSATVTARELKEQELNYSKRSYSTGIPKRTTSNETLRNESTIDSVPVLSAAVPMQRTTPAKSFGFSLVSKPSRSMPTLMRPSALFQHPKNSTATPSSPHLVRGFENDFLNSRSKTTVCSSSAFGLGRRDASISSRSLSVFHPGLNTPAASIGFPPLGVTSRVSSSTIESTATMVASDASEAENATTAMHQRSKGIKRFFEITSAFFKIGSSSVEPSSSSSHHQSMFARRSKTTHAEVGSTKPSKLRQRQPPYPVVPTSTESSSSDLTFESLSPSSIPTPPSIASERLHPQEMSNSATSAHQSTRLISRFIIEPESTTPVITRHRLQWKSFSSRPKLPTLKFTKKPATSQESLTDDARDVSVLESQHSHEDVLDGIESAADLRRVNTYAQEDLGLQEPLRAEIRSNSTATIAAKAASWQAMRGPPRGVIITVENEPLEVSLELARLYYDVCLSGLGVAEIAGRVDAGDY
ncbi:UNVERIFIED_CONTAM: hypothetical protein HDU68_003015 [Siphonaria sp. JEL0065]|nr:hypothetical protein HDU68_003015 [Siphonaria sp. JEL0065]